jgi:hypothetical protein
MNENETQMHFEASELGAVVSAKLDYSDSSAKIAAMPDQWFTREGLKELISFLKDVRKELK